jgi:hypothetical protein
MDRRVTAAEVTAREVAATPLAVADTHSAEVVEVVDTPAVVAIPAEVADTPAAVIAKT